MLLANIPVVKKPIAISQIKQAHQRVCSDSNALLCQSINTYLQRFQQMGLSQFSASIRTSDNDNQTATVANKRGLSYDANYLVNVSAHAQPLDYLALSVGAQLAKDNNNIEDTYLSLGTDWAQLDIGTKAHLWSPFSSSSMLISTHAQTLATVSLSSIRPLSSYNISYELFIGELSNSDHIFYQGRYTSGTPRITGIHIDFSPFEGFNIGINRIMQSGGGERSNNGISDILKAFINPSGEDNTNQSLSVDEQFGNQAASIVTQYQYMGDNPFSVYLEYAGEDTSSADNWRLGNATLSAGVFIPQFMPSLLTNLSLRYEWQELQPGWYAHHVYQDGLTNEGNIIGNWVAEWRADGQYPYGQAVGAQHHMISLNWHANRKNQYALQLDTVKNEDTSNTDGYKIHLSWQHQAQSLQWLTSLELINNEFDDDYYQFTLGCAW